MHVPSRMKSFKREGINIHHSLYKEKLRVGRRRMLLVRGFVAAKEERGRGDDALRQKKSKEETYVAIMLLSFLFFLYAISSIVLVVMSLQIICEYLRVPCSNRIDLILLKRLTCSPLCILIFCYSPLASDINSFSSHDGRF